MAGSTDEQETSTQHTDEEWFREPTAREHRIAAALFVSFGVFFVLFFFVTAGFWFRWVTLVLGIYSILHGMHHARDARHVGRATVPAKDGSDVMRA
jgi:hypothetical protein